MLQRFMAVLHARNLEFLRDTQAMIWSFMFPVLVVLGFGFAFSGSNQNVFKVGVHPAVGQSAFERTQYVEFVSQPSLEDSLAKLRRHGFDMVLSGGDYYINASSPKGYLLERILMGSGSGATAGAEGSAAADLRASGDAASSPSASSPSAAAASYSRKTVEGKEIRYVDWLISGMLAMNMMFSALFGVGYTIVRYRKNGVLKRLRATPLKAHEFLLAQVISRLILIVLITAVVYFGTNALIHFQMLGSYFNLFLVLTLGGMCLISLGLLVAARIASEELGGGILNLITWPMMFLSGVWFSLEGAHPWVRAAAQIFPLTHVIDASRAIMTEGAGLMQVSGNLIALVGMTLVFLVWGSLTFKWE